MFESFGKDYSSNKKYKDAENPNIGDSEFLLLYGEDKETALRTRDEETKTKEMTERVQRSLEEQGIQEENANLDQAA